jgi:hypothetical protein
MTLPHRQEWVLRRADRVLRRSDPDLASMLSIFARLAAAEGMPAREQLLPQRTWARRVLLGLAAAVTFGVVFAVGGGSRAAAACGRAFRALGRRVSGNPVTPAAGAAYRTRGRG